MALAMDGPDLLVVYGSNGLIRVNGFGNDHCFAIRMADDTALDPSGLSNLVFQLEAYCITNSIDFSNPEVVQADSNLVAMVDGSWQSDTNVIGYWVWAAMQGIGHELNGYAQSPAGDGVGNLLKYATGLSPSDPVELSDLYTFSNDSASGNFKMFFSRSKRANVSMVPEWAASLSSNWQSAGIQTVLLNESPTNELWEASLPLGQSGFMRLRAVLTE